MSSSQNDDLLDFFKLDAVITGKITTHIEYESNPARGTRNNKVEKKWYREKYIGGGAFGQVFREVRGESNNIERRAIKMMNKSDMQRHKLDYKKEVLALAKFSKPRYQQEELFVKFFGWFEDSFHVYLSMEYLELGDLEQHITVSITENDIKDITRDLLNGLGIMHRENFAHRDLKPANIFVVQKPPNKPWLVKIGDFGISKRAQSDVTALRTTIGTPLYMAPEITGDLDIDEPTSAYDNTVDIWSLGCVIYKIATQHVPFPRNTDIKRFCDGRVPFPENPLLEKMSVDGVEFVRKLIVPRPQSRLSAENALEESWLLQKNYSYSNKPVKIADTILTEKRNENILLSQMRSHEPATFQPLQYTSSSEYEGSQPSDFAGVVDSLDNQYPFADNILHQLKDSDRAVRLAAFKTLSSQYSLPDSILQALTSLLKDSDGAVRLASFKALSSQYTLPDHILEALASHLDDSSAAIRLAAAEALGTKYTLPDHILEALASHLDDSSAAIRLAAAKALGTKYTLPDHILEALASHLDDSSAAIRLAAAKALGTKYTLPDHILEALASHLDDSSAAIRLAAAEALGTKSFVLEDDIYKTLFSLALNDSNRKVRSAANAAMQNQFR